MDLLLHNNIFVDVLWSFLLQLEHVYMAGGNLAYYLSKNPISPLPLHIGEDVLNFAAISRTSFRAFAPLIEKHLYFRCPPRGSFQKYSPSGLVIMHEQAMANLPSSLKSLFIGPTVTLPITSLPSSLTHIQSNSRNIKFKQGFTFPPNISSIKCGSFLVTCEELPSTLTTLRTRFLYKRADDNTLQELDYEDASEKIRSLPSSLTQLEITLDGNAIHAVKLPPTLRRLTLGYIAKKTGFPELPNSLSHLTLSNCNAPHTTNPTSLIYLKQNAETIEQAYPPLPPSLLEFDLSETDEMEPELPTFPPSLTSLSLPHVSKPCNTFPASLIYLSVSDWEITTHLSPLNCLTTLIFPFDYRHSYPTLPQTLTHLIIGSFDNYHPLPAFPPHLVNLDITLSNSQWCPPFPDSLVHLSLWSYDMNENPLPPFPPSLVSLAYHGDTPIQSLPHKLSDLYYSSSKPAPPLPPSLLTLHFGSYTLPIPSPLPPGLRKLFFGADQSSYRKAYSHALPPLPLSLRYLGLPKLVNSKIQLISPLNLPPSLSPPQSHSRSPFPPLLWLECSSAWYTDFNMAAIVPDFCAIKFDSVN